MNKLIVTLFAVILFSGFAIGSANASTLDNKQFKFRVKNDISQRLMMELSKDRPPSPPIFSHSAPFYDDDNENVDDTNLTCVIDYEQGFSHEFRGR